MICGASAASAPMLLDASLSSIGISIDKKKIRKKISEFESENQISAYDEKKIFEYKQQLGHIDLFNYNPKFCNLPSENDEITRIIYWHGFGDRAKNHREQFENLSTSDFPVKTISFNFADAKLFQGLVETIRAARLINIGGIPDATVGLFAMIKCAINRIHFWNIGHSRGGAALIQAAHMVTYPEDYQDTWTKLQYPTPESRQDICQKIIEHHQQTFLANPLLNLRTVLQEKTNPQENSEELSRWQSIRKSFKKIFNIASESALHIATETNILAKPPIHLLIDENMQQFPIKIRQVDPEIKNYNLNTTLPLFVGKGDTIVTNIHDEELREIAHDRGNSLTVDYGNTCHGDINATMSDFAYILMKTRSMHAIETKLNLLLENCKKTDIFSEDELRFLQENEELIQKIELYDQKFENEVIAYEQLKENISVDETRIIESLRNVMQDREDAHLNLEEDFQNDMEKNFLRPLGKANDFANEIIRLQKRYDFIKNQVQSEKRESLQQLGDQLLHQFHILIENQKEGLFGHLHLFKEGETARDAFMRIYQGNKDIRLELQKLLRQWLLENE